jgi:hypothetical protein
MAELFSIFNIKSMDKNKYNEIDEIIGEEYYMLM